MAKTILGKVAFLDRGSYNSAVKYSRWDMVTTADSTYISLRDNNQGVPVANTEWWKCIANGKPATEAAEFAQTQGDYAKEQAETSESDHLIAVDDHTRADEDHALAAEDHSSAVVDHTLAQSDHTTAESDHTTASADHTTAASDHTRAAEDHATAVQDHSIATNDHTTASVDHAQAVIDHGNAVLTVPDQGLTDEQKANARENIGAGDAAEVTQLALQVTELEEEIRGQRELTSDFVWTDGHTLNATDGVIAASSVNSISNIIELPTGTKRIKIIVNKSTSLPQYGGLCFYDASQAYLSGIPCEGDPSLSERTFVEKIYDVPDDTIYIRTQIFTQFKSNFYCIALADSIASDIEDLKERTNNLGMRVDKLESPINNPYTFNLDFVNGRFDASIITGQYELLANRGIKLTNGFANRLKINKWISAADCSIVANIELTALDGSVCLSTHEEDDGPHATIVEFDFANSKLKVYPKSNGLSIPTNVLQEVSLTNVDGLRYAVEIGRKNREVYAAVINLKTNQRESVVISESNNLDYPAGWLHDYIMVSQLSGSVCYFQKIYGLLYKSDIVFLGDSITEGLKVPYSSCWCNKVISELGQGINFGSSGGRVSNCQMVVDTILKYIKPKYVVVTIGTNGGNTIQNLTNLKNSIMAWGGYPIFNHIAWYSSASTTQAINDIIDSLGCDGAKFDIATSNNNSVADGQNTSLFTSDGVHPNAEGHTIMAERFLTDLPYLKMILKS